MTTEINPEADKPAWTAEQERMRDAAPALYEALRDTIGRFRLCMVVSGTDPEYADIAVQAARAALAQAEGRDHG